MSGGVALATEGLTRRFGDVVAVDGMTLEAREGEVLGFLGPNGAGKTTSIRMMSGLLRPTAGRITVLGEEMRPQATAVRRRVGLCPQENVVYPELSALENLAYAGALYGLPPRVRRARAESLLADLGLAEKARTRADRLSGGMRRRLTLGLALVHDPPLVVLDEPEAGLDPQTRVAVREFIRAQKEARTVILTSHNMDEVERVADRVAIIDHGKLVKVGTPAELKATLGTGDNLEIALAQGDTGRVKGALAAAGFPDVSVEDHVVRVRALDLPKRFSLVLQAVADAGARVEDVTYRGNTLEDVFIHLTGRGLRE